MTRLKIGPQTLISAVLALLLFTSVFWQSALAQVTPRPPDQRSAAPAALSTTLSYYFISGYTFTNSGGVDFHRQFTGCVDYVPLYTYMSAPVHLPQASQVVTMTLFTYDSVLTDTRGQAQFNSNDGKGNLLSTGLFAGSAPQLTGYQHHDNPPASPVTIDNQTYAYQVDWRKPGSTDSPSLSLCGVRLAYYGPVGATFLPMVDN